MAVPLVEMLVTMMVQLSGHQRVRPLAIMMVLTMEMRLDLRFLKVLMMEQKRGHL